MRYITEQELRDTFALGVDQGYTVPAGVKLTPAARQYLMDLRIYPTQPVAMGTPAKEGVKPEHMTHLVPGQLVVKTHPRIALRGKLDTLEAEILIVQITAAERGESSLALWLTDALTLTRRVLGCEVSGKPLGDWMLDGLSPQAVHEASHKPQDFGFAGHVMPAPEQGMMPALINRLRAICREAELAANAAFCTPNGECTRCDLILALNRLSSYFYVLQLKSIQQKRV